MAKVTKEDLEAQVVELEEARSGYQRPDLFVAWVLKALVTENEDEVLRSLTNSPNDKDLDAVLVDHRARTVFLVQGKYRMRGFGTHREQRSDVISFASWATILNGQKSAFDQRRDRMNDVAKPAATTAWDMARRGYSVHLLFATTGRCSQNVIDDAEAEVRAQSGCNFELLDSKRVLLVLDDWVYGGVGPPVRRLSFPVESNILERPDPYSNVEAWVFSMRTADLAELYSSAGNRLFARNIRASLGSTAVNRAVKATATGSPEYFWYYNNGVTVVCDDAVESKRAGATLLNVSNPQIINGQQTTVSLGELDRHSSKSSLLVKVIKVPRQSDPERKRFDTLVSHIVEATNYQNPISTADLRSNDPLQIDLQRELYRRGYQYIRKSGQGTFVQALPGAGLPFKIRKEQLAAAIADCLDPALSRLAGPKRLFDLEHPHYERIFAPRSVEWRLACYWMKQDLERAVKEIGKTPERWQGRLIAQYFMWTELERDIKPRVATFISLGETWSNSDDLRQPFTRACKEVLRVVVHAYNKNKGRGQNELEPSRYFNRTEAYDDFKRMWKDSSQTATRQRFARHQDEFVRVLRQ
jgi:hypothetical protein